MIPSVMVSGGGTFGRWLGHKGGALMNGTGALMEEPPESSLTSPTSWGHNKMMVVYEPESNLSSDAGSASALILDV